MHDELQTLFDADARALRASAPPMSPAWRIAQIARERAARRMARRVRWMWRIALGAFIAGALPLAAHDPRALPALVLPLLLGALPCWRDEPGTLRER
ncbi:hypothetical protein LVB87_05280 [Lysobacter sp. KIS68-7]|uniref:hypothetical protein n=1 Tax=Lysobacter sp. KIS68-7 TaxID=2904252 RepID=UPI001E50F81A|nr:hypothetical protein [Lysobacter sp. KIS68-7]UHQ20568.1 hypothetical protein LVB87_05280 [Lysobacter sp. KIS68-7]